jgi:MFS superfamily sulfate permease-like transporter
MKNDTPSLDAIDPKNATAVPILRNRFDRLEWAGAFGDLGTLIPFVTAYIAVLKMDPLGILLAFGVSLVACGWFYRTPFPVQPMKAIGAVATTQAAHLALLTGGSVIAASLITGAFWLALGFSGLATRVARWVPREVVLGIVLGLGMSFMLEGSKMMSTDWPVACAGLLIAVLLRKSKAFPAMFILLVLGFIYSISKDATLLTQLEKISIGFRMPRLSVATISWNDLLLGAIYLALPQIPLTLGNAIIGTKEENNRLFPDRPVTVKGVSISTGLMNVFSAAIGGVPMCHGAGGMVAHTSFGARTGGSAIILGTLLITLALGFSSSIELLLRAFPPAVLGVILFMAGIMLALGNLPTQASKQQAFVVVATAGMAMWNVAAAFAIGLVLFQFARRGHLDA